MMRGVLSVSVVALTFALVPSPCFALWDVLQVSREEAKKLGLDVRTTASGSHVVVELEFKTDGNFKAFSADSKFKDSSGVWLSIGLEDNPLLSAALKEDRSKAGRVVVSFTADRVQLGLSNLQVRAPFTDGGAGGTEFRLRVKDFVESK
jgi:hypothetical protein